MAKIRVGVIGLGIICHTHIKGILASQDAELVAISDVREEALKAIGDQYGVPETHRFSSFVELLRSEEVDAVTICTPNDTHYDIVRNAIKYKKPFALEKPVTLNYKEAEELCKMADEAGVANMVCFSYRYKAAARFARWLVQSGALGKLYHVYGQYLQAWAISEDVPLLWRFSKKVSGSGALGDLGSHMIDLARFVVGEFDSVCGQTGTFITKRKLPGSETYGTVDVDDYCNFMAELEGGIPAMFAIARYAFGRGNYQRLEIYGEKGGLVYSLEDEDTLEVCIGDVYGRAHDFHRIPIPNEFKKDQMQAFFDILLGKADNLSATIHDGLANQKILDAILESFEGRKWLSIKEV
ncbi:MAG: Gfo/Idh/MocA family oxidoreductase [Clostridia bacterium]|nr:Gfo/Idh/MocA family oxidoreductase [Clostridia bacterium]